MEPTILDLFQKHGKEWAKNEQRKRQIRNKAYYEEPYPNCKDIYGRKRGEKNERRINGIVNQ